MMMMMMISEDACIVKRLQRQAGLANQRADL